MRRARIWRGPCVPSIRLPRQSCLSPLRIRRGLVHWAEAASSARSSAQQVRRSDPRYTRCRHLLPGTRKRAVEIDRATGIVYHDHFETRAARIERRPRDAIIRRQSAAIDALHAYIAEITREARRRDAIGLHERRITIDVHMMTLADHQPRVRHVQVAMQRRAVSVLDAMRWP